MRHGEAGVPALEVKGVTRTFGGLTALSDVSLVVHEGEILGLIGPNGAGKSTLFEVISGNLAPSAGRVSYFGTDITALPAHERRRAGLCRTFQKVRLFESLTVEENVSVAAMQCVPEGHDWRDDVARTLDRLGLTPLRARYPGELTLADRKRVEIARGLVGECRVLMLDESLSGLTHDEAGELVAEILALNSDRGVTVVVVEHVMPVIMALARRLVVLHYGKVIAEGTPKAVGANPVVIEAYLGTKVR